jgi:hypothetical protein
VRVLARVSGIDLLSVFSRRLPDLTETDAILHVLADGAPVIRRRRRVVRNDMVPLAGHRNLLLVNGVDVRCLLQDSIKVLAEATDREERASGRGFDQPVQGDAGHGRVHSRGNSVSILEMCLRPGRVMSGPQVLLEMISLRSVLRPLTMAVYPCG